MSDGTFCRICHRLMVQNSEQICVECKDAMKRAGYVKVVRCKDCKYLKKGKENDFWDNLSEADLMEPMHHFND